MTGASASASDAVHNLWFPVAIAAHIPGSAPRDSQLLGESIHIVDDHGEPVVTTATGRRLPVTIGHGHVWTSLGEPGELFPIPEGEQPGRRLVDVGVVRVQCSPLRAVENFLDIAHFPFVHTDILGAEPHTEVQKYRVEIREDVDEVWATDVQFYQPQAAKSASEGIETRYLYRVPHPTCTVLYKTSPPRPGEWDVIALFVQPLTEECCDVWPWMALFDDDTSMTDLIHFQQTIFLQDRSILENQLPRKLPLDPGAERPTQADHTSIVYRRWLKRHGYTYGATVTAA